MQKAGIFRSVFVLICAVAMTIPAFADIKAFNAAVKAGDYKTATAEAVAIWKTWDQSSEQTAVLAREFGFAALVAGRNDLARDFGRFLVEKGATLPTPDDQPLVSAVLFRAADYKLNKGNSQRDALRAALVARAGGPGMDMTSVLSWELLYTADWEATDWDNAIDDAKAAAAFFSRERTLLVRQRKAELQSASAIFVGARGRVTQSRNDLYTAMADVHDAVVADLVATKSASMRAELWPLKWKSEAWAIAIESYITSSYEQVGSNISTKLEARALIQPPFSEVPETSATPLCEGKFEGERLVYPQTKKFQGVGSMITRLETGPDGKVTKVEILGAVPNEEFVSGLVNTMKTWVYRPAAGIDRSACRLDFRNHYQKGVFRIL